MKVKSIHSKNRLVYHNNSLCTEKNNIEKENILEGTGNKRLCKHCQRLNKLTKD